MGMEGPMEFELDSEEDDGLCLASENVPSRSIILFSLKTVLDDTPAPSLRSTLVVS